MTIRTPQTARIALAALALALSLAPQTGRAAPESPAAAVPDAIPSHTYGPHGIDLDGRDLSVKPGDDFQLHATGHWLATHEIPADRASISTGYEEFERAQAQVRALIAKAPTASGFGALFASYMDEARLEKLGAKPLLADLAAIRAMPDGADGKSAMARFMGSSQARFGSTLVAWQVVPDFDHPETNVLLVAQDGMGLPDRDYYLTERFQPQREAYAAYIERTLALIGQPDAKAAAEAVMAFETALAKVAWTAADKRDIVKIKNVTSSDGLAALAPGFDWTAWAAGVGLAPQARMIVADNTAIRDTAALFRDTPMATLKAWQAFHVADQAAPYLSKAFVDSRFAFSKSLSGVATIEPRWKRGVDLVNDQVGEMVGREYAARYFPASAKARMIALVGNLKAAMADRIRASAWMSEPTRTAALEKLARMEVMVGYPDKWRDWAGLDLVPSDLYGNVRRAVAFNAAYNLADLGKPVDKTRWGMNPQTVDAYNNFLTNQIVFPAGILQAPDFDPAVDDAVNYGAIGAIIGHEISHGFDDQGRKVDATGAVRDWWTPADAAGFEARAKVLGDQFAKFEPLPGLFINAQLTMGENIADFAGLVVAHDAWRRSLNGQEPPLIDGLTGDQRFFLSFAQSWRGKARDDAVRRQVASDPHSPRRFRLIGPVRNIQAWYDAFGVKPGDKMYIPPEQRAAIW